MDDPLNDFDKVIYQLDGSASMYLIYLPMYHKLVHVYSVRFGSKEFNCVPTTSLNFGDALAVSNFMY